MFRDEELDDKELKSKLTVYNEVDIEMDRTALIKQHLDGLKKTSKTETLNSPSRVHPISTCKTIAKNSLFRVHYR